MFLLALLQQLTAAASRVCGSATVRFQEAQSRPGMPRISMRFVLLRPSPRRLDSPRCPRLHESFAAQLHCGAFLMPEWWTRQFPQ
eukprot:3335765-Amphidinium_carterae.1